MIASVRNAFARLLDRLAIRQQIALFSAGLCGLLIVVVAFGASQMAGDQAISDARARERAVAHSMAQRLDQEMFERYRQILYVAQLDTLRPPWASDPSRLERALEQLQASMPVFAWLGVAEMDGVVRASTRGMLRGKSVARRPWFIHGAKDATVETVHEATLLAELLGRSPDGAPFRFVDVATPLKNAAGETVGVLGAHLSWSWAAETRRTVLEQQDASGLMEIVVYDADGSVLLGPANSPALDKATREAAVAGRKADLSFVDEKGPMLASVVATKGLSDYPGLGWLVMAREPAEAALAPARRLSALIFGLGGAMLLAGVGLAWAVAGNLARPIAALRRDLDLVFRDSARANVSRQRGSADILALSGAVRSLLRRVTAAELTVEQATRQIEEAQIETDQFRRAAEELAKVNEAQSRQLGADIESLRVLADTDALTGLLNRRAFLPLAADTFDLHRRYKRDFAVLLIDIDHFKLINDRFGHAAGDEVLRMVAGVLHAEVRATDKAARFGGEEFVVLLREVSAEHAQTIARIVLRAIEAATVHHGFYTVRATASAGLATADGADRDVQDMLERADAALYAAKRGGRNRVEIAGPRAGEPLALAS